MDLTFWQILWKRTQNDSKIWVFDGGRCSIIWVYVGGRCSTTCDGWFSDSESFVKHLQDLRASSFCCRISIRHMMSALLCRSLHLSHTHTHTHTLLRVHHKTFTHNRIEHSSSVSQMNHQRRRRHQFWDWNSLAPCFKARHSIFSPSWCIIGP